MKILAIDTATTTCSAAIIRNDAVIDERIGGRGITHARVLMDMINEILAGAGWKSCDIDAYAVTIGPGSFTGLRIGLATVKGLAFSRRTPVIGISTLDALAAPLFDTAGRVCAMIDARRGEVYAAFYRRGSSDFIQDGPALALPPAKVVAAVDEDTVFAGDGALAYRELIAEKLPGRARLADPHQHVIRASAVAGLGLNRLLSGMTGDVYTIAPLYLRKSDAEK